METIAMAILWNSIFAFCLASIVVGLSFSSVLKSRPAFRHALWLILLAKMITPPLIQFPVFASSSMFGIASSDGRESKENAIASQDVSQSARLALTLVQEGDELRQVNAVNPPSIPKTDKVSVAEPLRMNKWNSILSCILPVALLISLAGTCMIACVMTTRGYCVGKILSHAELVPGELQRTASQIAKSMGLLVVPRIRMVDARISPMLWASLYRPTIVFPKELIQQLSEKQITTVIAHEIAHFARLDHWSSCFASVVLAIFWWHPLVWFAQRQLRQAQEECCDALIIDNGTAERRQYAETLLAIVDFQSDQQTIFPIVSPGMGNALSLRRRLEMLRLNSVRYRLALPSKILSYTLLITLPCVPSWSEEVNELTQKPDAVTTEETALSPNNNKQDNWSEFKDHPHSRDLLFKVLPELCRTADERFGKWYISGVFEAARNKKEPFFVVQIYDGTKKESFRLGMLAIVSSKGEFIQALEKVRITSAFLSEEDRQSEQLGEEKILLLPDLNADGFSEIPTERWDINDAGNRSTGRTNLVYSTRNDVLELIFQIQFPRNASEEDDHDVSFSGWCLARIPESQNGMAVISRLMVPFDEQEHRLQLIRLVGSFWEMENMIKDRTGVATTRIRFTRVIDETQPHRVMATFSWSDEKQVFAGPRRGPHGAWQVILPHGVESSK